MHESPHGFDFAPQNLQHGSGSGGVGSPVVVVVGSAPAPVVDESRFSGTEVVDPKAEVPPGASGTVGGHPASRNAKIPQARGLGILCVRLVVKRYSIGADCSRRQRSTSNRPTRRRFGLAATVSIAVS